jgi:O-antigen/teichoic acid export membrane protein
VPGVVWGGLTGACWGALASELLVAALGFAWTRPFLVLRQVRLSPRELAPYLRFGTRFAAGTLLLALSQRSGELLLRVSAVDFAAIGVFGVAYRAYLAGNFTLWHLSMSFAPELSAMAAAGDRRALARWVERLMTAGAVVATIVVLAALFLGDVLLPLVLGERFAGAAPHLVPLALAMVGMTLAAICRMEAIVLDRWDLSLGGSVIHLAVFWGAGYLLVGRLGPLGASLAALVAATLYGGFMALAIRRSVGHRLDRWSRAVALGLPFLALAGLRGGPAVDVLLFAVAIAGYAVLLVRFDVIRRDELAALRAILLRREVVASPAEEE